MAAPDIRSLQAGLTAALRRADRSRRIVRWTKIPVFLILLLWMLFVLAANLAGPCFLTAEEYGFVSSRIMVWMLPAMGLQVLLELVFVRAYGAFARQEQEAVSHIVTTLFPGAKFRVPAHDVPDSVLRSSLFFGGYARSGSICASAFASLELPAAGGKLTVVDLGIAKNAPGNGGVGSLYKAMIRPLFTPRVENTLYDFRGMFAWTELGERLPGTVVILPDHLEGRLGHLARSVQRLKEEEGRRLVQLEDPEFECLFAVYASDEVLCRRVLTPAMMRDITRLRRKYGRDMMLTFNTTRFCIAVSMPDGFLSLRAGADGNGRVVEEIQADIAAAESILRDLRLE